MCVGKKKKRFSVISIYFNHVIVVVVVYTSLCWVFMCVCVSSLLIVIVAINRRLFVCIHAHILTHKIIFRKGSISFCIRFFCFCFVNLICFLCVCSFHSSCMICIYPYIVRGLDISIFFFICSMFQAYKTMVARFQSF